MQALRFYDEARLHKWRAVQILSSLRGGREETPPEGEEGTLGRSAEARSGRRDFIVKLSCYAVPVRLNPKVFVPHDLQWFFKRSSDEFTLHVPEELAVGS